MTEPARSPDQRLAIAGQVPSQWYLDLKSENERLRQGLIDLEARRSKEVQAVTRRAEAELAAREQQLQKQERELVAARIDKAEAERQLASLRAEKNDPG